MTLPANWSTVTVTHKYGSVGGEPIKGYVGFANTVRLTDAAAGLSVPPSVEPVKLDNTGAFSLPLPVCDDPDIAPTGWYYRVTENLTMPDGSLQVNTYLVQLTASMAPSVDLADLVPVTDVAEVTPYARLGVEVVTLPAPSGVDDTAAVNVALTKHAGKRVAGRPGAAYRISAPLVVYSGTTLDMTSCTVTLLPGSNCNLLQNRAVTTVRRVLDAVTTGGSATLTSATAAFVSGDVGKPITVQGAGASGAPLTTTISAVTNGTTATLAIAASTTVSGQYAAIGARDSSITVIGGLWDRTTNGPSGTWNAHALRFRHVDDLTVTGVTVDGDTGSKYAVNPGDCTRVRVIDPSFPDYGSDGVHLNGPCSQVLIRGAIGGTMHDDLVSLTARDSTPVITDCAGDITDVVVETATLKNATFTASALKVVAGKTTDGSADYAVRRLTARNLTGPTTTAAVVFCGDTSGGQIDDVDIDGVTSLGGTNREVVLLRGGTVGTVKVRRVTPAAGDRHSVAVDATVTRLEVSDIDAHNRLNGSVGVYLSTTGNVDSLIVDNVRGKGTVPNQQVVRVDGGGRVGSLHATRLDFEAAAGADGSRVVDCPTGSTLTVAQLDAIRTVNVDYPLGVFAGTTTLIPGTVHGAGMNSWLWARGGSAITLLASAQMLGDQDKLKEDVAGSTVVTRRNALTMDPDLLTTGEETLPRLMVSGGQVASSGQLLLTYFTARKTETINNVRTMTEGTAAATPTLCRIGVYSVAANGDLTLVASMANDTTLWAGTFSNYTRALTAPFSKVAGRRYVLGVLYVGTTAPKLRAIAPLNGSEGGQSPRINGSVAGQADLPSSVTVATVTNSQGISVYAAVTP